MTVPSERTHRSIGLTILAQYIHNMANVPLNIGCVNVSYIDFNNDMSFKSEQAKSILYSTFHRQQNKIKSNIGKQQSKEKTPDKNVQEQIRHQVK